jgi:hypothetical protein
MRKIRIIIAIIAFVLMLLTLTFIDYNDLSWSVNKSNYLGLITGVVIIVTAIYSNNYEKKQAKNAKQQ